MALSISSLDAADITSLSFLLGTLFSIVSMGIVNTFLANRKEKYQKLIRSTEYLISANEQIVTVADLVFKTKLSPQECQKFLDKLVVQLDGEINYTESGKLYYQFPTADNLELTQGKKYQKLIRWTEHLLSYNNQMVTVTDLVLKTELSPQECKQFLDKFAVELKGEIIHAESGQVYYQFPSAKSLELKTLAG